MLCSERRERPCNYKRIDPIWVSLGGPTGSGGGVRRRRGSGRPHAAPTPARPRRAINTAELPYRYQCRPVVVKVGMFVCAFGNKMALKH